MFCNIFLKVSTCIGAVALFLVAGLFMALFSLRQRASGVRVRVWLRVILKYVVAGP